MVGIAGLMACMIETTSCIAGGFHFPSVAKIVTFAIIEVNLILSYNYGKKNLYLYLLRSNYSH